MSKKLKEHLALYSENCLTCKSLVEYATKANPDCHWKQGNEQCPAREVKIVVVGEALEIAQKVIRARDKRMAVTEAQLMKYVGKQSAAWRSKFYTYLENGAELDK